jgi:RNA polymerase sigma-70 factor (ECF subfamily)
MDNDELSEAIAAAQNGDVDAFARIFEEYRPVVYTVAYRLVGPNDADDVTMETYLKAWRAFPKFKGKSAVKTWLYRITHNCATDFIRSRTRRKEDILPGNDQDDRSISDLHDPSSPAPDSAIVHDEMKARIQTAVAKLDEAHRVTIELRFIDDMSYADIAAATNVSIGTVMSRLFNGKRKLKKIMQDMP